MRIFRIEQLGRYCRCICPLLFLTAVLTSGCVTVHKGSERAPETLPKEIADYYSYPKELSTPQFGRTKDKKKYVCHEIYLPLQLPDEPLFSQPHILKSFLHNTIRMDYRVPKGLKDGEKVPAIMVTPILGGNEVAEIFAKYFAEHGYITLLVHHKRPSKPDIDMGKMYNVETHLRISVLRLKQAMDWLQDQSHVDEKRMGTFGISYGSIINSNFIAVDKRPKYNVLMLSGAPVADVLIDSREDGVEKMIEELKWGYLDENDIIQISSKQQVRDRLYGLIKTDAILLGKYIDPERVLMYVALFDKIVAAKHGRTMWKALGEPKLRAIPFGHYSSVVLLPAIQIQILHDFKENL